MKKPNPKAQQKLVDDWNAKHPIGTIVTRYKLINPLREPEDTKTRSEAWLMGGHTAMVLVESVAGGVMVESVVVRKSQACFVHPDRESTDTLKIPCAPGGKLHVCAECAKPESIGIVWEAYKKSHGENIAQFKAVSAGREGLN